MFPHRKSGNFFNLLCTHFLLTTNQPVTNHDFKTESDIRGPTASDGVDIRKNRVHMLKTKRQNHGGRFKRC